MRYTPTTTSEWRPQRAGRLQGRGELYISTTVLGLGERAGSSALEEVVAGLARFTGRDIRLDRTYFGRLRRCVAGAAKRPTPHLMVWEPAASCLKKNSAGTVRER